MCAWWATHDVKVIQQCRSMSGLSKNFGACFVIHLDHAIFSSYTWQTVCYWFGEFWPDMSHEVTFYMLFGCSYRSAWMWESEIQTQSHRHHACQFKDENKMKNHTQKKLKREQKSESVNQIDKDKHVSTLSENKKNCRK